MRRALSGAEEQAVRLLFNLTADHLGIARPLDPVGWHKVKDYLRGQYAGSASEEWTREYAWHYAAACANLEIDPFPPRKGFWRVAGPLLSWIGSPADRHGRISELFRGVFALVIASLAGAATVLVAHHSGGASDFGAFMLGGVVGLLLLGFAISSDTHMGAQGLFFFVVGVYSLAAGNWALSEWFRITAASSGAVVGAYIVSAWLRPAG